MQREVDNITRIEDKIKNSLNKLYEDDIFLFERNDGNGVCERCIVFRLAHSLQLEFNNFFVDCDFNSSFEYTSTENGRENEKERSGKEIENEDGTGTKRFVDIIIHKRNYFIDNDFICFEIKKWNNTNRDNVRKDLNNIKQLTTTYGYKCGYHIILGKVKGETKWTIINNGKIIKENELIYID